MCVDPGRDPYPVLIGGNDWATELRAEEARALCDGCSLLAEELEAIAHRLMPEERVTLELERGPLWMELEGRPFSCRLRFVLSPGPSARGVEAGWDEPASAALMAALRQARATSAMRLL